VFVNDHRMAKRKTEQTSKLSATNLKVAPPEVFPELSIKENLECRVLLEDQILLIDVCGICYLMALSFWKLLIFRTYSLLLNVKLSSSSSTTFLSSLRHRKREGRRTGLTVKIYILVSSMSSTCLCRSFFCDVGGFCNKVAHGTRVLFAFTSLPSVSETRWFR
jgi:hypothetical protein